MKRAVSLLLRLCLQAEVAEIEITPHPGHCMADYFEEGNEGVNKDNVLSWK